MLPPRLVIHFYATVVRVLANGVLLGTLRTINPKFAELRIFRWVFIKRDKGCTNVLRRVLGIVWSYTVPPVSLCAVGLVLPVWFNDQLAIQEKMG